MYDWIDLEPPPSGTNPQPLSVDSSGISQEDIALIKLTAQFVAHYGKVFWLNLVRLVIHDYDQFKFLYKTDHRFSFYTALVLLYQRVFKPSTTREIEIATLQGFFISANIDVDDIGFPDVHMEPDFIKLLASVNGLDFFIHLDDPDCSSAIMPPPQPLSVTVKHLDHVPLLAAQEPEPVLRLPLDPVFKIITPEELGIVKFTALFVARFGKHFHSALMRRVLTNPRFQFLFFDLVNYPQFHSMELPQIMYYVYDALVDSYSKVLLPSKKFKNRKSVEPVLEFFFHRLQCQKLEEGDETAVTDLLAFVSGLDIFARIDDPRYPTRIDDYYCPAILDPPVGLSVICNRPTHIYPPILVQLPQKTPQPPPGFVSMLDKPYVSARNIATTFPSRITLKELAVIKLTAQFVQRYGTYFLPALEKRVATDPLFRFLNPESLRAPFYDGFLSAYMGVFKHSSKVAKCFGDNDDFAYILDDFFSCLQLEKLAVGDETAMVEVNAFMSGFDFFAHMDDPDFSAIMPPPQLFSEMMSNRTTQMHPDMLVQLPHRNDILQVHDASATHECVCDVQPSLEPTLRPLCSAPFICHDWDATPGELSIIKLTALFVARYGMLFCRDLVKKVGVEGMKDRFKFMEPTDDERFRFYNRVVVAYSRVLKPYQNLYRETVLERYFECLKWENGRLIDWHAFAEGVDYFARMEDADYAEVLLTLTARRSRVQVAPLLEKPEPKRQKFDESFVVPEDQFLVEHPGSCTIKLIIRHLNYYPRDFGPQEVIEMTVKSLSENVASLKEKLAGTIERPASRLRLIGKAGYLQDDKSLAHYNVGDGEMLTVTWRNSRWT